MEKGRQYDVAIVGLGPAGATLARLLGSHLRVIALDKKRKGEGGFQKPCGGLLAPDAQKALSRFGLTLPKDVLVDPQIFGVKTIDLRHDLTRHYQRHYINMNRDKFDRWLIGLIPPKVELRKDTICTGVKRVDGTFLIEFLENGERKAVSARYLVGADGANSIVRRMLYPGFKIRRYLSIQQWYKDVHPTPFYSCVFDPAITDSYCWGLTKDDCFIFGGAFNEKTGAADFERVKQKLADYGFCLQSPFKTEACQVLRPFGLYNYCHGEGGAFFIGEAAGFISPSSLEGISYALESAWLLSGCLNKGGGNPNREYRAKTGKIRLKLFLKHLKSPFMYTSFLRRLVMQSGVTSIKMVGTK